ncbi:hypothetical protein [Colwellia sp. C1TZA3]|uniref:hypothetical protein n=1 Tax=Colwellia sp. C1TZA3 TaxID=2508879 RepID=UPI0011B98D5A|nr:hypothetical protein [Colwellia sp. C1TZA3]TWX64214.1 hypothetical protein ESZ39_16280 [Colwellia sp. C1TZA3]
MRNSLILIVFLLSGCGAIECLDSQFEREPIQIEGNNIIEFQYKDEAAIKKNMKCEKFYDAMCAERGNYWAVREVGFKRKYRTSKIEFFANGIGNVKISQPTCDDLIENKKITLESLNVTIDGSHYYFNKTIDGIHHYKTSENIKNKPVKYAELDFELRVNGLVVI